jgi:hypothetical protein
MPMMKRMRAAATTEDRLPVLPYETRFKTQAMANQTQKVEFLLAEFKGPSELVAAAAKLRDAGYRDFDAHTPFPIHGLDRAMGLKPSILGVLVFIGGLVGACTGLGLQYWVSTAAYPITVSGKPFFSLPAFIPVTFEVCILFSAFVAVFGMLLLNRLPQPYHPLFNATAFERASDDAFFLSVASNDAKFSVEGTKALLEKAGGYNVEAVKA